MPLTNNQVSALLRSVMHGNAADIHNTFAAVSRQFSAAKQNDSVRKWLETTCRQITGLLDSGVKSAQYAGNLPVAADQVKPTITLEELRLTPALCESVESILADRRNAEKLREHNLRPTRAVLLHGPSGTGKTSIAKAIAYELGLPLRREDAAELVGIHMGDGPRNVSRMFDSIASQECLLLLDECDVLLMQRDARSSLAREENSITAQFLQGMDDLPDSCLVIGTTNHPEFLDSAMLRRFQHIIEVGLPSKPEILKHAVSLAKKYKIPEDAISLGDFGHSYATCVREVERLARAWIIENS